MDFTDRHGKVITLDEWATLIQDLEYKRVGSTTIGPWWVSTVWLGIPLTGTFETMVFRQNDQTIPDWADELCARYPTETEALAGHEAICRLVELAVEQNLDAPQP